MTSEERPTRRGIVVVLVIGLVVSGIGLYVMTRPVTPEVQAIRNACQYGFDLGTDVAENDPYNVYVYYESDCGTIDLTYIGPMVPGVLEKYCVDGFDAGRIASGLEPQQAWSESLCSSYAGREVSD